MSEENLQVRHFLVTGRVQGVAYRASACAEARRLGLDGWVRNLADGAVETVARGPATQLAAYARWLRRGPPAARVDDVSERESTVDVAPGFEIR